MASGRWTRRAARRALSGAPRRHNGVVSIGEALLEERRRRRRAGDPRLNEADRELLRRPTTGDLVDAFQAGPDAVSDSDPLLVSGDKRRLIRRPEPCSWSTSTWPR